MNTGHADHAHDDAGQDHTQGNSQGGGFDAHVQEGRSQGAGPGAGAGDGNAHKQQQGNEQAVASGFFPQLPAAFFALFNAEGEKSADVFFIPAPLQHLAGEEIDDGHREHITDDADGQGFKIIQSHTHRNGYAAPQFDQRDHGYEKAQQVFFQHFYIPRKV